MYKIKAGVQGNVTRDVSQFPTCWKTKTLPPQLGKTISGPVGPSDNKGCRNRIYGHTSQNVRPFQQKWSETDSIALQEEITSMLNKGAIIKLSEREAQNGFYSNMFLIPKKDGKMRPVINLKKLNQFVHLHHFKMESIQTARELVQPNEWMTKIDLKDAYFTVARYQFTCLLFGLSSAPWVFTKTLRPVTAKLRELRIRLVIYLDNNYTGDREQPSTNSRSQK